MKKVLSKMDYILSHFENITLFVITLVALGIVLVNIFLRTFMSSSINWSDEVVRAMIQYIAFIGCSAAIKAQSMIKVDAFAQIFPRTEKYLKFIYLVSIICFTLLLIYFGILLCNEMALSCMATVILGIPYKYLYLMLPLMGFLMLMRTVQEIYKFFYNDDER